MKKRPHGVDSVRVRSKPTIIDVANLAGVHPSTASRALNQESGRRVSSATTVRVLAAAKKLGYRPNPLARGLKIGSRSTVGMLIPDLTNPLFPPIIRGIEDRLREAGWTLLLANSDNDEDKERLLLGNLLAQHVDGLILATARRDYPLLEEVIAAEMPIVLVNRTIDQPDVSAVAADDDAGIGLAVGHLAAIGHRKIAYVGGPRTVSTGRNRYQSFLSWLHSENLELDDGRIVFADWFQEDSGIEAFEELISRQVDFTAVVCGNDLLALGGYEVLARHGLRVPDDVSIVGYNDVPFCGKVAPPLTSVRVPQYHIGVTAAELLLDLTTKRDRPQVSMSLRPELAVRASTGPPPGEHDRVRRAQHGESPRHSVSVGAVVVGPDSQILAIRRRDTGTWTVPGGLVEIDESPLDAVRREVLEETGVQVEPEILTGTYKNMSLGVVSLVFRCRPVGGHPHPTAEATAVGWLSPNEIADSMPEAFASRVRDALAGSGPYVRVHDGTNLLEP